MGLFGGSAVAVDPEFSAVVVSGKSEKATLKELRKCQDQLRAVLEPGEVVELASHHTGTGSKLLVVTNQRSLSLKPRRIDKELRHSDVAETRLLQHPSFMIVAIESLASRRDYHPDDPKRFAQIIQVNVPTPGEANQICAAIDRHL